MGAINRTKVLNLPQWEGNEYFTRLDMNDSFADIEDAVVSFDFLMQKYGYTLAIDKSTENKVFTYTIKSGCPYTATKIVTKSVVDGMTQFRTQITIDGTVTIFVDKKTSTGWEGSVE